MPNSFIDTLRNEISKLEQELDANPTFRKLQSLRGSLRLYETLEASNSHRDVPTATKQNLNKTGRKPSEARQHALELSENFLRSLEHTHPTPTREILDAITIEGAEIGGKDPVSNLSAMLSQSDQFQANGRSGWTLVPEVSMQENTSEAALKAISNSLSPPEHRGPMLPNPNPFQGLMPPPSQHPVPPNTQPVTPPRINPSNPFRRPPSET